MYAQLKDVALKIIKARLLKYSWSEICLIDYENEEGRTSLSEFLAPFTVLKALEKKSYYEMVEKYKSKMGEEFPYDMHESINKDL